MIIPGDGLKWFKCRLFYRTFGNISSCANNAGPWQAKELQVEAQTYDVPDHEPITRRKQFRMKKTKRDEKQKKKTEKSAEKQNGQATSKKRKSTATNPPKAKQPASGKKKVKTLDDSDETKKKRQCKAKAKAKQNKACEQTEEHPSPDPTLKSAIAAQEVTANEIRGESFDTVNKETCKSQKSPSKPQMTRKRSKLALMEKQAQLRKSKAPAQTEQESEAKEQEQKKPSRSKAKADKSNSRSKNAESKEQTAPSRKRRQHATTDAPRPATSRNRRSRGVSQVEIQPSQEFVNMVKDIMIECRDSKCTHPSWNMKELEPKDSHIEISTYWSRNAVGVKIKEPGKKKKKQICYFGCKTSCVYSNLSLAKVFVPNSVFLMGCAGDITCWRQIKIGQTHRVQICSHYCFCSRLSYSLDLLKHMHL